ncbi:MAG: lamin tail domain-containing protein [Lewinellaceae bacterium]|nr:lamin tail domain-containing protein [Lewinellaceae bacterium]
MNPKSTTWVLGVVLSVFTLFSPTGLKSQDVILQGFYWNTIPGDITSNSGVWWDTIAGVAPLLSDMGFQTVWTPPANKGYGGVYDMGYGIYDYFDFGQYNQKGSTRTRHGNQAQFQNMMSALHGAGLKVMADLVLNHRGGGDSQSFEDCDNGDGLDLRWNVFNPLSGRLPMDASFFHPNSQPGHCNYDPPYHEALFFEDLCYFNDVNQVLAPPTNDWYFGPHNLGKGGDSLIIWGRYLLDVVGFDELRLDAVKHIEPGFLAPFLVELHNGNQPFAVGELFDGNLGTLKGYHDEVEGFNVAGPGAGSKDANLAIFDFNLRYALRDMCNDGSGGFNMWNLNSSGLVLGGGVSGYDVVTFVENHDVDRIGWQVVNCGDPHDLQIGSSCMKLYTDGGHDPIFSDKEDMAYPYIMAAEGRPTVFWKDLFWYGMDDDIRWQMALREATATGGSGRIQDLNSFFNSGHGGDVFVLNRYGTTSGASDGMVLALNDSPGTEASVWVNTPFSNKYLKDYSDGYLFVTTQAYADSRANVKAQPRDYAWWSVTGLYPKPPGMGMNYFYENNSYVKAEPGGCPHYIALRVADAANLLVNGAPIAVGDEVAVKNSAGVIVGIGRIGQSTQWDGVHDMLIEVLGAPSANGMGNGEAFTFVVHDASANTDVTIGAVQYAPVGTSFSFSADRPNSPNRNGNYSTFNVTTTRTGLYDCGGISQVLAFENTVVPLSDRCGSISQASAGVYGDGLQEGDNDGSRFEAWTNIQTPGTPTYSGVFIGSSTGNGDGDFNGDGDIGTSWGFYANTSNTAEATRPFSNPLSVGQTFSIQMDNGWIDNGGTVGFGLQNNIGQNVWEFYFTGGGSSYTINEGSGPVATLVGFTDEGLVLDFLLTSSTTYQLTLTELINGNTHTYTGSLMSPGGGSTIDRVRLFNYNAGNGGTQDAFFNSMQICNAPALIINEVDYDQVGTDLQEFIELRNMNTEVLDLSAFTLELVNGGDNSVYRTVNLPSVSLAAGDYFVICANGSTVPNCDYHFDGAQSNRIENGAPDGMRLLWNEVSIDALSYEGDVPGAGEGSGAGLEDSNTTPGVGLSRVPDGSDTNHNNVDFELTCITPGAANSPDNTDTDGDVAPDACDSCPLAANEGSIANFNTSTCACDLGYYAVTATVNGQEVITGCQQCPSGTFCPDGVHSYLCPAGEYQSLPGQSECLACLPGTFSSVEGAVFCTACVPGYFQANPGATACEACQPGTFQGNAGASACELCPQGRYNPNSAATSCIDCPTGTHASNQGQVVCETCEPGSEAPFTGMVLCDNCVPPSFGDCPAVTPVNNTSGQCDGSVTVATPALDPGCTRNHALDFDGVDDYASVNDDPSLDMTGNISFEAWVYVKGPNSYGSFQSIMDKTETADLANYRFYLRPADNKMGFYNGSTVAISTSPVPYGQWVHLAWVLESGTMTFYQNGVQDGTGTISLGATNNGPLSIGRDNNQVHPDQRNINMMLDEVRLWNIPRSQADIQATMNLEINSTYSGLVVYYNFNEGIACCDNTGLTTLPDGMPVPKDGTLFNFDLMAGCSSNWVAGAPALGLPLTLTNDWTNDCSDASGTYSVGMTTVTWTATGANGETAICVQTITVNDTEMPTAACQNTTVDLVSPGAYTLTTAEIDGGSTDNCPANLDLSIPPTSFSCSDVGNTIPIVLTVSDGTNSTSCTAQVTVADGNSLCNASFDIAILDPCSCLDNATTLTDGQFSETVQVTGPAGDNWTVVAAPGLYQTASPAPPAAPLPIAVGTVLVEGPAGEYTLSGKHVDAQGYSVTVTNGTETLSISNTCYYPNPSLSGLDPLYCSLDGPQTATVTAQLGDNSGAATIENILFELVRQSDNSVVDSQSGTGDTYNFDPSTLSDGHYTIRATFDAAYDADIHPGCVQEVEEAFEVRRVGCGAFPWEGN